jgi:hypothetical protein
MRVRLLRPIEVSGVRIEALELRQLTDEDLEEAAKIEDATSRTILLAARLASVDQEVIEDLRGRDFLAVNDAIGQLARSLAGDRRAKSRRGKRRGR